SNPPPAFALTTTWTQSGGPGSVMLSESNALMTTARFSSEGIYSLSFTANNGGVTTVPFTVVVGEVGDLTNGLLAWWRMTNAAGSVATDSSGNGRDATLSSAVFTNFGSGFPSNALRFNGSTSYATFASPEVTQLTLTAWARANGQGNSQFPRIF